MPSGNKTEIVTYTPNKYTLTINYRYQNGSQAAPSYTGQFDCNAKYSIRSSVIKDYDCNAPTVSGNMPAQNKTITVTYTPHKYILTIRYLFSDGKTAATPYVVTLVSGSPFNVKSPDVTGYTPDKAVVTGTMSSADKTLAVYYTPNKYKLTINYRYSDGRQAAPPHTSQVAYNATYSVKSPTIAGYAPDMETVTGKMPASDKTVTVTYGSSNYKLTIKYQFDDGTQAAPTYTGNFNSGASYSINSPSVTDFEPYPAVVSGTMPAYDREVTVLYKVKKYWLNIYYHAPLGGVPYHKQTFAPGEEYSIPSIVVAGYTADKPLVSGTMPKNDVDVHVWYTKDGDSSSGGGTTPDTNINTDGDGKPDTNIDTDGDGKPDKNVDSGGSGGGSGGNCNCGCGGGSCGSGGNSCGCCGGHCGGGGSSGGSGLDGFNWENLIHKPGEAPDIDMPSGGYLPNGIEDDFGITQPEEPPFGDLDWRVLYPGDYEGAEWDFKDTESYPETSLPEFPKARAGEVPDGEDILDGMTKLEGSGDYSLDHYKSMYDEKWFN